MLVRKLLYLLAVTILVASVPCLAADESLTYTGDLFAPYAMTYFSALATDDGGGVSGVPLLFQGTTVWNRQWNAGPVNTNSVGKAYIKALWPADIYEMKVVGKGGEFNGLTSPPEAVTIFNPLFAGIFAGGAIDLNSFGVPPNIQTTPYPRMITYGIFDRQIEAKPTTVLGEHPQITFTGNPSRLLVLDPFNPLGAVRITAQNYKTDLVLGKPAPGVVGVPADLTSAHLYGYCTFQQGSTVIPWARFDAYLDTGPLFLGGTVGIDGGVIESEHPYFEIFVWQYPQQWLYGAEGVTYDGGAFLKCTGGHKPPP